MTLILLMATISTMKALVHEPNVAKPLHPYSGKQSLRLINFFCNAPQAMSVRLIGDFNGWQPLAHPMQRMPDGVWMTTVELLHGYHRYLFLVDGRPVLDPSAHGRTIRKHYRPCRLVYEPVSLIAVS
jgi:1,4-alpha-glucan branching enzyme